METGKPDIEKSIREAQDILQMPGAFLRETGIERLPYEAVFPGTWTSYQSRGIKKKAFELMLQRAMLSQIGPRRWTLASSLPNRDALTIH